MSAERLPGCPSPFALERYAVGELETEKRAALRAHLTDCPRCVARLAEMESQAARFSRSRLSLPARAAFARADRKWRRTAVLVALAPAIAAALVAAVPYLERNGAAPAPRAFAPEVHARTPRALLEPRGAEAVPRLRQLSVRGQPVDFGQGTLEAAPSRGPSRPFVLKHTEVAAEVTGFVSSVTVTQEFENPFAEPVEAIYVFPLPEDAAVDRMTLTAGARVIRATIQKREQARRMYEEAKHHGRRAALLDQERPNIFTQSVANLLPGESVKVTLRYLAPLRYDDGVYTLNFPMVVGPRYIPGAPVAGQPQGTGQSPDTDQVIDASRITPPAQRTGRDITLTVKLDAGSAIEDLASVSHRLWAERPSARQAVVTLDGADRIANKDFILRWQVAGTQKRAALLATGGRGGTFSLMVMPEAREARAAIVPKELVFVIDTSCSMSGAPLAAEKRAMRSALEQLNPDDTFMVIDFADRASSFHPEPLANTATNVRRALSYLEALPASGGTNQLDGIHKALSLPANPSRLRMVLFMTDGFIGNEAQVLAAVERELGEARLFSFGVGTSVNHFLLSRLAEVGRGFYQYVRPDEDPEPAVERFVRRIERPLLTDIEVDWGILKVAEVLPRKVPDLFDAQPLVLLGRYQEPGRGLVTVRGRQAGRPVELRLDVALPEAPGGAPGLPALWARARIEELDRQQHGGERPEVIREITTLGLEHHLVTAYTSLVAVDEVPVAKPGTLRTVTVPTEEPEPTEDLDGDDRLAPNDPAPALQGVQTEGKNLDEGGRYARKTTINFSDDTIEGDLARPSGELIDGRRRAQFKSLIKVRDNFDDKVLERSRPTGGEYKEGGVMGPRPGTAAGKGGVQGGEHPPTVSTPVGHAALVTGSINREVIQKVIRAHLNRIRACFEKALRVQPTLGGKLVLEWTIVANGKTARVRVKSSELTGHDPVFESCVVREIETWVFPAPAGGGEVVLSYPFMFQPQGH